MRKSALAVAVATVGIGMLSVSALHRDVAAQAPAAQTGWLEGFLRNEAGTTVLSGRVSVLRNGQVVAAVDASRTEGGYYGFRNLKPGIYEVRATDPMWHKHRALRVWGVVVKADARTSLDLTMEAGGDRPMQEIGKPTVETTPVIPLSQKLAHLQAQIDDLKKQQAALRASR